jgi:hypothetical protein
MAEPLLDFGNVRAILQGVGCSAGTRHMRMTGYAELQRVAAHDLVNAIGGQHGFGHGTPSALFPIKSRMQKWLRRRDDSAQYALPDSPSSRAPSLLLAHEVEGAFVALKGRTP